MVGETISDKDLRPHSRNRRYSYLKITAIPCLRCGVCCQKYQPRLTADEVAQLAQRLGLNLPEFIDHYTDRHWPGTQSYLLRQQNGACLFLEASGKITARLCRIQGFKPAACCLWDADLRKPECQEGLKKRFNLVVDSRVRICGDPADLDHFEKYVNSLKS